MAGRCAVILIFPSCGFTGACMASILWVSPFSCKMKFRGRRAPHVTPPATNQSYHSHQPTFWQHALTSIVLVPVHVLPTADISDAPEHSRTCHLCFGRISCTPYKWRIMCWRICSQTTHQHHRFVFVAREAGEAGHRACFKHYRRSLECTTAMCKGEILWHRNEWFS